MALAIEAVERAFRDRADGALVAPPRHHVTFPGHGDLVFTIGGSVKGTPVAGFRVYDTFDGALRKRTQIVAVWDAETIELQGLILGKRLGEIRTGAIGAIAIKHMASAEASSIGLVGTGGQARSQLEAAAAVRHIRNIRVFSPNEQKCRTFAAEMKMRLGVKVEPVKSAAAAVDGADIVVLATNSASPVIEAQWIKPGAHITTLGSKTVKSHELGLDVAAKAAVVATDAPEQTHAYRPPFFLDGTPMGKRMVDLADIVSGKVPVRHGNDEMTLFCSVGLAGTEVLVASKLIEHYRAKAKP